MKSQEFLAVIRRNLRASLVETGELRPIDEIACRIKNELDPRDRQQSDNRRPIPIATVAAMVDGTLGQPEANQIIESALGDPTLMMELVSAVRDVDARSQTLPPLDDGLQSRLLQMTDRLPKSSVPITEVTVEPVAETPAPRDRRPIIMAVLLATAAVSIGVLFQAFRSSPPSPQQTEIALDTSRGSAKEPEPRAAEKRIVTTEQAGPRRDNPSNKVPPDSPSPQTIAQDVTPAVDPTTTKLDQPELSDVAAAPNRMERVSNDRDASDSPPTVASQPIIPPRSIDNPANDNPALGNLRWSRVTGLLAERKPKPAESDYDEEVFASIEETSVTPIDQIRPIELLTLPYSRAEAEFEGGGEMVLSDDTRCQLGARRSGSPVTIRLRNGSIALKQIPPGVVLRLIVGRAETKEFRWQTKANLVIGYGPAGLETHVDGGTVSVDGVELTDQSIGIAYDASTIPIEHPKRMPTWTQRPTMPLSMPRHVLAQFHQSDHLSDSLDQSIRLLSRRSQAEDADTLMLLAKWRASLGQNDLIALAASPVAFQRTAALERLVGTPNWDPRYELIWRRIAGKARNPRVVPAIRSLCDKARQGIPPNSAEVERLLNGLALPESSTRALCDYLLRIFNGGGPPFDPHWTGALQDRAIAAWRKQLGRTDVRLPRATVAPTDRG